MNILLLLALLLCSVSCHKKEEPKKPLFQVEVTKPKVEDITLYHSYVGHVEAYVQVDVTAQVEGVLTGYYFTEGMEVKQGDLIFSIDSRPYEAQLSKTEAALSHSIANLRYAEDVAKRNASLAQKDYVSQLEYDEYITNVMTSKATIKENEAEIDTAKINITYCNIHAPMNAVSGKLKIQVGNLIRNAGEEALVTLNQITPIYTYFSVPQKDLPHIMELHRKKALKVEAFLNGDESKPYCGDLDLIDNQVNDQTGSIWLRGVFANEEKLLWPGEFVDVNLMLEEKKNAILLPTNAITLGQKGKYVFILKSNQTVELRYIETGEAIGSMTLIEKGIEPGETVVTQGQINLTNGIQVKVKS
ncbi:MAG: Multidrug resistance protein MdtA [Chlamydiae bacterium]|nr:Multidrug resistance protein MdtA [Chlamydiota bacterium]